MPALTPHDLAGALPDLSADVAIAALHADVDVWRDALGIPHAMAASAHDAFLAQGFFCAQDRLWQMDWDRRRACGRAAEWLGESAVEQDAFLRRMGLDASARADYAAVDDDARAMLDAYAEGVNAFLESGAPLPIEYKLLGEQPEPWRPWDGLAIFKVRHVFMGTFEFKLWRGRLIDAIGPDSTAALFPVHDPGDLVIIPTGAEYSGAPDAPDVTPADMMRVAARAPLRAALEGEPPDAGSNSWALSPSRTSTGGPLLAGDSHRQPDTPNVYYQNHIACPEFDVVGLSFAGLPGFHHFGHNAYVAWCVTHTAADYQDLYVERFDPDNPARYQLRSEWPDAEWREAAVREETLRVRGGEDVAITVTETVHGPVVFGDPASGHAVSLRYTATDRPGRWAESIRRMLTARDCDEFEAAQEQWVDPCNNLLSADVHGNISYLMRGRLPLRSRINAWAPIRGWTGDHEWHTDAPFGRHPRSRNPDAGYIVTANNRVLADPPRYYIGYDFVPDLRARALDERLRDLAGADHDAMEWLHATRRSRLAQQVAPLFAAAPAEGAVEEAARALLASWDGSMDREAPAPTVYAFAMTELLRTVCERLIGPELTAEALAGTGRGAGAMTRTLRKRIGVAVESGDGIPPPPVWRWAWEREREIERAAKMGIGAEEWAPLAAAAFREGVRRMRALLGDDPDGWAWGELHRTRHAHPLSAAFPEEAPLLDPPSIAVSGDGETPLQGAYVGDDPFTAVSVSVARYVYDPHDWRASRWIVPLGASGHPGSPHYADQQETWASVRTLPMLYAWDDVRASAQSAQRLRPA